MRVGIFKVILFYIQKAMFNPNSNIMKTKLRTLLLLPFFALLMVTSCQDEVTEISTPAEAEALTATSELTTLMSSTAKLDGSKDNIIDNASCLSIELPVTVIVRGLEIIIDSEEDYKVIKTLFDEFDNDDDNLDIVFPITIVLSDFEEIVLENSQAFQELVQDCVGENEEDDDIECIDFKYPLAFSVYNTAFQVIDVKTIEDDRGLYHFLKRVKNEGGFLASINFPVTLVLADGSEIVVTNNEELQNNIREQKNACDEDDDNDYHDNDFDKERLDGLLMTCPWVVYEFERNQDNLIEQYNEYAIQFKADNVVKMRARGGDMLTGKWSTRVTDNGALINLEFDNLADFTLEWFVYDLGPGKIKLYQAGGNRIILKKNCDVVIDITKQRIENYLQECFWRVSRLNVNGADNEKEYIGTPLKFLPNNVVKLRVNGELVAGTYEIGARNAGFVLQVNLEGRPNLNLEWLITFLESGLIKLENANNQMVLKRHCPDADDDLTFVDNVLINGEWEVAAYHNDGVNKPEEFFMYTLNFMETGRVKVTDPNEGVFSGSWLAYRNEGLYLGLFFGNNAPFDDLNHRWKIKEIAENRIELKDYSSTGAIERILVLEKKI